MPDNILGNRYEITEFIGEGGVGVVYKAADLNTGSEVAIKFLIQEQTADRKAQEVRKRYFEREIALLTKIRHEGIVSLIDSGFTSLGLPYFVMEYVEGRTLAETLSEEHKLILGRVFSILKPLCLALDCIHKHGAIHRDLKPENIMITTINDKMGIKLLDFGIAKMLEYQEGPFMPITQVGNIVGTVDYLAPEQWEDTDLDNRTDIYALGLLTYEMLTGLNPFRSDTIAQSMLMHLNEAAPPPSSINKEIPIMLDDVILKSIAKKKIDRYSSAMEFLEDFENVLAEIYRRKLSYLSNPATETLMFEIPTELEDEL